MAGSFQNEIPAARINLKLDVGKGNARKKMELPLKMLVVGDFSFKKRTGRVADREKLAVTRGNIGQIMQSMGLELSYEVDNKLGGQGPIPVRLPVRDTDSLRPENVARAVPELSRLLAARNLLKDLKSNLLDNREFRKRLEEQIRNRESVEALHRELQQVAPTRPLIAS